jgi:riboflavin-specific deaminase-like protein
MTVQQFHEALSCLRDCDPDRAFVIAQLGQTLDGRIATQTGESKYINGPGALDYLHKLRAAVDAVVVGVGTVIADNPSLTVRRVAGASPARVIIDPNARLPDSAECLRDDGRRIFVVSVARTPRPANVEMILVPREADGLCPRAIVAALAERGMRRILVEGGAQTISRFIQAGALDRLHILTAPMIIGSGKPGLVLPPIDSLAQALSPRTRAYPLPEGDVIFDCDMRRTNQE